MKCAMTICTALTIIGAYALDLSFQVFDESNSPVTNATIRLETEADPMGRLVTSPKKRHEVWTVDKMGCASGAFTCYSTSLHVTTKAPGFYDEYSHAHFKAKRTSFLSEVRTADKQTFRIVLRRTINPIPMYSYSGWPDVKMPSGRGRFGFDMIERDWVTPHGNGRVTDFVIEYESLKSGDEVLYSVTLSFPNAQDGAYKKKKHLSYSFKSDYHADKSACYQDRVKLYSFKKSGNNYSVDRFVTKEDYLILRTRTKVDSNGNLISAHYSKVYGPIYVEDIFYFRACVFNPNENDTNLESDPERNLVPKRKRRKMGSKEP